jgi:hypothetical protein
MNESLEQKVQRWHSIMEFTRKSGAKYPDQCPFLYDRDWPEIERREKELAERKRRVGK